MSILSSPLQRTMLPVRPDFGVFDWVFNSNLSNTDVQRWRPATDIREESDRFVITADVPGVPVEDIEVTVNDGHLTVKGERDVKRVDENHGGHVRYERISGKFERTFGLPDTADNDSVSAQSRDGVLEIVVKKRESVQPRRIEVST